MADLRDMTGNGKEARGSSGVKKLAQGVQERSPSSSNLIQLNTRRSLTDLLYRNTKLYCNSFVFLHHYGKKPNDYLEIVLMFEHYLLSATSDFPFAAKSLVRVLFF
jgi:hypothetical protein